jgi:hypothetical protein
MVEMYKTIEADKEHHKAICGHCGKLTYPSHKNIYVFFGFMCSDTKKFVNNDCRTDFYNRKNAGEYGIQHANKYSETPVIVPWTKCPERKPVQLTLF